VEKNNKARTIVELVTISGNYTDSTMEQGYKPKSTSEENSVGCHCSSPETIIFALGFFSLLP
jgi:hypothetical protein